MPSEITAAAELADYPLGSTFTDRQGDVWMIDRFHPRGTGPQRIAVAGVSSSWLVLHAQKPRCLCGYEGTPEECAAIRGEQ